MSEFLFYVLFDLEKILKESNSSLFLNRLLFFAIITTIDTSIFTTSRIFECSCLSLVLNLKIIVKQYHIHPNGPPNRVGDDKDIFPYGTWRNEIYFLVIFVNKIVSEIFFLWLSDKIIN